MAKERDPAVSDLERRKQVRVPPARRPVDHAAEVRGADLLRRQGPRQPALLPLQGTGAFPPQPHGRQAHARRGPESVREALPPRTPDAGRPGGVRQQLLQRRPGAERVAAGPASSSSTAARSGSAARWLQSFTNILYIKIPIFDPGPAPAADAALRWRGSSPTWFLPLSVGVMLAAVVLVLTPLRHVPRQAAAVPASSSASRRSSTCGSPWAS